MPYELISHTADYAARIRAETEEGLFLEAAGALVSMITDPGLLSGGKPVTVTAEGDDRADLMVNWLREILSFFVVDGLIVRISGIESLTETAVSALGTAVPFDPAKHPVYKEIKAVTYHAARAERAGSGWEAQIVFDV